MAQLMDRDEARAAQVSFQRGVAAWLAVSGLMLCLSGALMMWSIPLGNAMTEGAVSGQQLAILFMGAAMLPVVAIALQWSSSQARLAEARAILAAPPSPEWEATERRMQECLKRTEDPEVRATLLDLHSALREEVRLAAIGGPGSASEERTRQLLAEADDAIRRLVEPTGPSPAQDALARLAAHAEVQTAGDDRAARARAAASKIGERA